MKLSRLRQAPWFRILAGVAIGLAAGACQISSHAYRSNLADHPDEPAHFVSALCVLDYVRTAFGTNPVGFAEAYYAHYPKVALGHWPPLFYAIQALWYGIAGASVSQAILIAGTAAALTAILLLFRLQRLYGKLIALLAVGVFLWLPLVRASELMLMADMPACFFELLAVLALCDACIFKASKYWGWLGLWLAAAILTKESALTLVLVVPLVLVCIGGRKLLVSSRAQPAIWAIPILLLPLAVYAAGRFWRIGAAPLFLGVPDAWRRLPILKAFPDNLSPVFLAVLGLAIASLAWVGNSRGSDRGVHAITAAIWLGVTLICQPFFRDSFEPRYLLPAVLASAMLFADGLSLVRRHFTGSLGKNTITGLAAAAIAIACMASTPPLRMHRRSGYAEVAASLPADPDGHVVLVSSDASGEGAMVAELLLRDPARANAVLRATKLLSTSDWLGRNYALTVSSAESVLQILDSIPVHFVVVDRYGFIDDLTHLHHRLLEETIRDHPGQFLLVGDFPVYLDGHRHDHSVQVYENLAARGRRPKTIHVHMAETLGHDLEIPMNPRNGPAPPAALKPDHETPPADVPASEFSIAPLHDSFPARGGTGRIYITAPPGEPWTFQDVPEWIRIQDRKGTGDRIVSYEVSENRTNGRRSATMSAGKSTFFVTQPRSTQSYPPIFEDFPGLIGPAWALHPPDAVSVADPPTQWVLDDQSGHGAQVLPNRDNGAVRGLILVKPVSDEAWKTRVSLGGIVLEPGKRYQVCIWMKADNPNPVWLTFRAAGPPYGDCGLVREMPVGKIWDEYDVEFQPPETCGGGNATFSLEAGKMVGRLWFGQFSLAKAR
ncbi:MAG TPA: glycosyltransferase family 39 protein [Bryobacteraceae bacterium]|nr:glycosyltransferase family 39 protein [Bryobacteraceae bacterium]